MNPAQLSENLDNSFTRKFGFPKERTAGKVVGYLRDSNIEFAISFEQKVKVSELGCSACFGATCAVKGDVRRG